MGFPLVAEVVQFSSPIYIASESYYGTLIQLTRSGPATDVATVEIVVADGSATQGVDFTLATNVVTFAAGETNAGVALSVLSDGITEPVENATLTLANPSSGLDLGESKVATLAIYDQTTRVRFESAPYYWYEPDPSLLTVVVLRTGNLAVPFSLEVHTQDVSAKAGEDYVAATGLLNFAPGVDRATISLKILNDALKENQESFRLILTNATPWVDVRIPSTVVYIQDDDLGYSICCTGMTIDENAGSVSLSVSRQGSYDFTSTVDYYTVPGTATPDLDYTPVAGTIVFGPYENQKTIRVPILNDTITEANETFRVVLTNASSGLTIDSNQRQAGVTIVDNDRGFRFVTSSLTVQESQSEAVLQVLRANDEAVEMSVDFFTVSATAIADADYTPVSGTLTFESGEVSKEIRIPILNDGIRESTKYFRVTLTNASPGQALGSINSAVVNIVDNDRGFSFDETIYNVQEGVPEVAIYVNRGTDAPGDVTVDYAVEPGTAIPDADYTPVSGTLVFGVNEIIKAIRVPILNDSLRESEEWFRIVLSNPSAGASLGSRSSTTVRIQDNDPGFSFQARDINVAEWASEVTVWVNRGTDLPGEVSVDYSTIPGTATPSADYTPVSGTLLFGTNEISKPIRIPILNDALIEKEEIFRIELSHPSGAIGLGPLTTAYVHIQDNDLGFVLECHPGDPCDSVMENGGVAKIDVVIRGDFILTQPVSVDFLTLPITATPDADYRTMASTLTFAPGETRKTISIPILNDQLTEPTESFKIVLKNPTDLAIYDRGEFQINIQDNELGYRLEQNLGSDRLTVQEMDGEVVVNIYRDGDFDISSSVDYRISSANSGGDALGTATPGQDYVATSGTVVFGPGETKKAIVLRLLDDSTFEIPETLWIVLSKPTGGVNIATPERLVVIQDNERNPIRIDPDFNPEVSYSRGGYGANDANLQVLLDGRIVMATPLWRLTGEDEVGIVRLLRDGNLDPTFKMAKVSNFQALAVQTNGQVLLAGDPQFAVNGVTVRSIIRLNANGSNDTTFTANLPTTVNSIVALAALRDGKILVATDDTHLFRLRPDGALDTSFAEVRLDGGILRIAEDSVHRVLIYGYFSVVNDRPMPRLARLLPDGKLDVAYLAQWTLNQIEEYFLQADDTVIVRYSGDNGPILARLTLDGILDPTFKSFVAPNPNVQVEFMTSTSGGKILAALRAGDGSRFMSRLNSDGMPDETYPLASYALNFAGGGWWGASFSATSEPDGNLLLKGDLTSVNGQRRPGLARLLVNAPTPRLEIDAPSAEVLETNGPVRVTLVRAGNNATPFNISWATDGGTAQPGIDYVPAAGTLTFEAGESEKTIPLQLRDNTNLDGDRTLRFRLSTAGGAALPPVELTILNDDLGFVPGASRQVANGRFLMSITGFRHQNYVRIQRSTNLRDWDDWVELGSESKVLDVEASQADFERQFYRLMADPQ